MTEIACVVGLLAVICISYQLGRVDGYWQRAAEDRDRSGGR